MYVIRDCSSVPLIGLHVLPLQFGGDVTIWGFGFSYQKIASPPYLKKKCFYFYFLSVLTACGSSQARAGTPITAATEATTMTVLGP